MNDDTGSEEFVILGPYVLNKAKVDSYSYIVYLSNGMKLLIGECEGPFQEGGETWYDFLIHERIDEHINDLDCLSRKTVSVNAKHIIMVTELES